MCGRFAASASVEEIVETFAVDEVVDAPPPTWNAAPTDPVAAVVERRERTSGRPVRRLVSPRWGLVPSWAKDARGGARLINARVETVAEKPSFARAFAARRCLVPAVGHYEWTTVPVPGGRSRKQPWFIGPAGGGVWAMAGLYEFWRDPGLGPTAPWLTTCTIITTASTDALGRLHDRMPMIVHPRDWAAWLDPQMVDPPTARGLLRAPGGEEVRVHAVAPWVNRVGVDGPQLIEPIG